MLHLSRPDFVLITYQFVEVLSRQKSNQTDNTGRSFPCIPSTRKRYGEVVSCTAPYFSPDIGHRIKGILSCAIALLPLSTAG